MKKQLITLFVSALAFVPALSAQAVVDGVESIRYEVLMSPSHQSPPILATDASGEATVEFNIKRTAGAITSAVVDFHVNWRAGQPEEPRAMHIHRGVAGANGPVVIDTALGLLAASEGSMVFRQAEITTPAQIAIVEEVLANPAGFYLNMHTVSRPGGIIRGQLRKESATQLKETEARLQSALNVIDSMLRPLAGFPPKPR